MYVCVCVCVCVYNIFIHLSINGQLGCFHILAIENNAAVNIPELSSFWISVFVSFGKYLVVELLIKCYSIFNFFFQAPPYCSAYCCINLHSHNSVQGWFFLYILTDTCHLFDSSHSDRYKVIFHCGFELHFLEISDEYLFMVCWLWVGLI